MTALELFAGAGGAADVRELHYAALAGTIDVLWASPSSGEWSTNRLVDHARRRRPRDHQTACARLAGVIQVLAGRAVTTTIDLGRRGPACCLPSRGGGGHLQRQAAPQLSQVANTLHRTAQ